MDKKEIARDLIALGSIPFYILVIARSLIGDYYLFFYQLIIALILLFLVNIIFKNFNQHLSRAFVLVVFTIIFYKQLIYTVFAVIVFLFLLVSLVYLKIDKKEISFGLVLGVISSLIGYYLAPFLI
tara:strand:+ start:171 stop:548 length:378 start_codon:yes stop_codon:yes gene_type:complete